MNNGMKKYLGPSFKCESDSVSVIRLSRKIVGRKRGRAAVRSIFRYVKDQVRYDIVDVVGAKGVLKRKPKKAVCIDKTNLMVALCRASGIPARYIALDVKLKTKNDIPVLKHMLAEVFYGGRWHKLDPTFGKSSSNFINASKFEKIDNWKGKSKETRFPSLPWFIPILTWFMYRLDKNVLRLKRTIRLGSYRKPV